MTKAVGVVASMALLAGCFGYNHSAKGWAYVGDTMLMLGGGAAIALDVTSKPAACSGPGCPYESPVGGGLVAGALLVSAGLFGMIFNATRPDLDIKHH